MQSLKLVTPIYLHSNNCYVSQWHAWTYICIFTYACANIIMLIISWSTLQSNHSVNPEQSSSDMKLWRWQRVKWPASVDRRPTYSKLKDIIVKWINQLHIFPTWWNPQVKIVIGIFLSIPIEFIIQNQMYLKGFHLTHSLSMSNQISANPKWPNAIYVYSFQYIDFVLLSIWLKRIKLEVKYFAFNVVTNCIISVYKYLQFNGIYSEWNRKG